MGLACLSGILAFQKIKINSQQTTEKAKHYITALCSRDFLLTDDNWNEHVLSDTSEGVKPEFNDGIIIQNFVPTAFNASCNRFSAINLSIRSGTSYTFQAPSGHGKSIFLLALLHMVEHTGDIYLIQNGKITNVHTLSREEWQSGVIYHRDEDLNQTARLSDLFSEIYLIEQPAIYQQMMKAFGHELTHMAFRGSDNLIEMEISALENGKKSPFSPKMLPLLKSMREDRYLYVNNILKMGFGNPHPLHPGRVFCTLSAREKKRIVNLITFGKAKTNPNPYLIIFDEPLANLDEASIERQLNLIKNILANTSAPMFIISHHHIQQLKEISNRC